jgi:hypothetical protein
MSDTVVFELVQDGVLVADDGIDQPAIAPTETVTTVTLEPEVYSLVQDIDHASWTIVAILIAFCFAYFSLRWF